MQRSRHFLLAAIVAMLAVTFAVPAASASSDLNGDNRDDLVIGSPNEAVGRVAGAGVVIVLLGRISGLSARGYRMWSQADFGGTVEDQDRFGVAIAYGDFDNDGFDDAAIGAPAEDWSGRERAGVVHIAYGSRRGPRARNVSVISQVGKMAGANEDGDFFGAVLAAGNFNGDAYDDLVISVIGEDIRGKIAAGSIVVAYGSADGIRSNGSQVLSQRGKVPGGPEDSDGFGAALAVGDFNNDDFDDIAVGTPGEDTGAVVDAGTVTVFFGRAGKISGSAAVAFSQGGDVPGENEARDEFGYALAAGDFNGDDTDDFAVGVRGQDVDGVENAGDVVVFNGSAAGPTAANSYRFSQAGGISDDNEAFDYFGSTLAAGDFNRDGRDDLAVGAPSETVAGLQNAGQVTIVHGAPGGLGTGGSTPITQADLPNEAPEANDRFGETMRAGDFNGDVSGDDPDDLATGSPFEARGNRSMSGVVHVVSGSASGLDLTTTKRWHQNSGGIKGSSERNDRFGEGL
jgi:hypothetical protein